MGDLARTSHPGGESSQSGGMEEQIPKVPEVQVAPGVPISLIFPHSTLTEAGLSGDGAQAAPSKAWSHLHEPQRRCRSVFWALCSWRTVFSAIWSPADPGSPPAMLPRPPLPAPGPGERQVGGTAHQQDPRCQKAVPPTHSLLRTHGNTLFAQAQGAGIQECRTQE